MEIHSYWQKQTPSKPLFPDIEWSKPEQRALSGRLGIIGGNKLGFAGVAESYSTALKTGVGEVRVLLPDVLRKTIPPTISDALFGATNPSGSLAKEASTEMRALGSWAQQILLVGDAGRNSETAIVYEDFLHDYTGQLTITRDAVDLIKNSAQAIVERPDTLLVISFAQLQKLFQAVYYPKILTFSMQLSSLVEAVHKFTITYPVSIMVLHKDYLIVASEGAVTTTEWGNPMAIWRGSVATVAASYWLWNPKSLLKAATASIAAQE
jgi:NAD(P)H-hydrate repair Nnr-like enzyme with NAD(P)H-hydrate dehydratase domain